MPRRSVFRVAAAAVVVASLNACASTAVRPAEYLGTNPAGPPRPFSPAVRLNGFLYLSGQVGSDSTGKVVAGGIKTETKQVMENIGRVLTANGSSFSRVVKCTVFLADMGEWGAMNEVYATFFPADKRPARSAMGVNGLALGARTEIECIAY